MPVLAKLGKKCQIVIPKQIRNNLGIAEGDELIIESFEDRIILIQKPDSYSRKLKGLHKDIWQGVDPKKYVKKERKAW